MNILMVCMGNICRSPMAEGIARHIAAQTGRDDLHFDSAGTHAYHIGEAPDERAQAEMQRRGLDISDLRARAFRQEDFSEFDVIMVADDHNAENVRAMAGNDEQRSKIIKMLDSGCGSDENVADPYYGGEEGFARVYQQLHSALTTYLDRL